MKIVNAMLGLGLGGIEQSLVDYCDALLLAGHEVHVVIQPGAAIMPALNSRKWTLHPILIPDIGDPIALLKLKILLSKLQPDACIAHGNRAASFLRSAGATRLIGPMHNYQIQCKSLDAIFCPTKDLIAYVKRQGVPDDRIYSIPNIVRVPPLKERKWHQPPVVGSMGRFVAKKGFDLFIEALATLKSEGVPFHALLAGNGEEESKLQSLAKNKNLHETLTFTGWVDDKDAFFDRIDLFCLPSYHEPFGIVLIEAMARALPVVSTASEGPSEIITDGINGMIVPINDPSLMAKTLKSLLADPKHAEKLGKNAYQTALERYDLPIVSAKIDCSLSEIVKKG